MTYKTVRSIIYGPADHITALIVSFQLSNGNSFFTKMKEYLQRGLIPTFDPNEKDWGVLELNIEEAAYVYEGDVAVNWSKLCSLATDHYDLYYEFIGVSPVDNKITRDGNPENQNFLYIPDPVILCEIPPLDPIPVLAL